jgi:ankyrin repeat protein
MVKSNHLLLIAAAYYGNVAIMKQYLSSYDPMVNFTITPDSQTALWLACKCGHINIVKLLLAHKDIDVNKKDKTSGTTPLMICASMGSSHIDILHLLIASDGIDLNATMG